MTEEFLSYAMEQYGGTVYRIALCRLQNAADAEDVFQDSFLRLCQQRRAVTWDDEHLKAWLLKVTINRCRDIGRERQRKSHISLEDLTGLSGGEIDGGFEVWEAVSHLPEKQRLIFHLYYGEEYKTQEIAGILGMSDTAVRANLSRARTALRKELNINGEL